MMLRPRIDRVPFRVKYCKYRDIVSTVLLHDLNSLSLIFQRMMNNLPMLLDDIEIDVITNSYFASNLCTGSFESRESGVYIFKKGRLLVYVTTDEIISFVCGMFKHIPYFVQIGHCRLCPRLVDPYTVGHFVHHATTL